MKLASLVDVCMHARRITLYWRESLEKEIIKRRKYHKNIRSLCPKAGLSPYFPYVFDSYIETCPKQFLSPNDIGYFPYQRCKNYLSFIRACSDGILYLCRKKAYPVDSESTYANLEVYVCARRFQIFPNAILFYIRIQPFQAVLRRHRQEI